MAFQNAKMLPKTKFPKRSNESREQQHGSTAARSYGG
jgi:hypothetical protein